MQERENADKKENKKIQKITNYTHVDL